MLKSLFTAFAHTQNAPPVELLEVSKISSGSTNHNKFLVIFFFQKNLNKLAQLFQVSIHFDPQQQTTENSTVSMSKYSAK